MKRFFSFVDHRLLVFLWYINTITEKVFFSNPMIRSGKYGQWMPPLSTRIRGISSFSLVRVTRHGGTRPGKRRRLGAQFYKRGPWLTEDCIVYL